MIHFFFGILLFLICFVFFKKIEHFSDRMVFQNPSNTPIGCDSPDSHSSTHVHGNCPPTSCPHGFGLKDVPSGEYQICESCVGNEYKSGSAASPCQICPRGSYTTGLVAGVRGNTACSLCPRGSRCPNGNTMHNCIGNEYQSFTGQGQCETCPSDHKQMGSRWCFKPISDSSKFYLRGDVPGITKKLKVVNADGVSSGYLGGVDSKLTLTSDGYWFRTSYCDGDDYCTIRHNSESKCWNYHDSFGDTANAVQHNRDKCSPRTTNKKFQVMENADEYLTDSSEETKYIIEYPDTGNCAKIGTNNHVQMTGDRTNSKDCQLFELMDSP